MRFICLRASTSLLGLRQWSNSLFEYFERRSDRTLMNLAGDLLTFNFTGCSITTMICTYTLHLQTFTDPYRTFTDLTRFT